MPDTTHGFACHNHSMNNQSPENIKLDEAIALLKTNGY